MKYHKMGSQPFIFEPFMKHFVSSFFDGDPPFYVKKQKAQKAQESSIKLSHILFTHKFNSKDNYFSPFQYVNGDIPIDSQYVNWGLTLSKNLAFQINGKNLAFQINGKKLLED